MSNEGLLRPLQVLSQLHSYVSRLDFVSPLDLLWSEIWKFRSLSGKVSGIQQSSACERCIEFSPDLSLLVLGGNDINFSAGPRLHAHEIKSLAFLLEEVTGSHCHILSNEPAYSLME